MTSQQKAEIENLRGQINELESKITVLSRSDEPNGQTEPSAPPEPPQGQRDYAGEYMANRENYRR